MDRHFMKQKLESKLMCIPYAFKQYHLANVLTKGLDNSDFHNIVSKLCMEKTYSQGPVEV